MGVDNFSLSYNQMGLIATVELSEVSILKSNNSIFAGCSS